MYRRIVVGLDGSAAAASAADYAASLALLQHGRVTLVSVAESVARFVGSRNQAARGAREAVVRLEEAQRSAVLRTRRRGVEVEAVVRRGVPREELLRAVETFSADLLVVGRSTGQSGGGLGSDAAHLSRDASCSVLLIPEAASVPPARMVIGYDGSPAAAQALEVGRSVATAYGARLIVAVAAQAASEPWSRSAGLPAAGTTQRRISVVELRGEPAPAILEEARRDDVQLIVLGSTGVRHPWGRDLGGTAARVARDARVCVLIVRLPTIARTVSELMRRDVETVSPDTKVRDSTALLLERGIKSLPVIDADGRVVGIVTLGDLLRRAGVSMRPSFVGGIAEGGMAEYLGGLGSRDRTVREIMSHQVVTIEPERPATEAVALLGKHRVKRLPVVAADGRLIGIVSRADLLRGVTGIVEHDDVTMRRAITGTIAADIMQHAVPTVSTGASLEEAARAVLTSSVGRVAVVDDQERVAGVISTRDLLPLATGHSFRQLLDALGPAAAPRESFLASLGRRADGARAMDLMRRNVITVPPDASLDHVLRVMMTRGLKRLLVADSSRRLVGAVDRADIMRCIAPALGTETR
ncbi:MAG: CBS domain-containing protein [Chloroflexi bacterium]|nr:CBS domain-containing protein [Chloroflexota bacterium]